MLRYDLRDHRGELRRVGDHEEPPDEREQQQDPEGAAKHGSREDAARSARGHGADHDAIVPNAIRQPPAPEAPEPSDGDDGKRGHAQRRHRDVTAACRDARREEGGNPRPERIQLPHVPEVATGGEPPLSMAQDGLGELPGERSTRKGIRSVAVKEQYQHRGKHCAHGDRQHHERDSARDPRFHEVRRRLAHGQRTDDGADRESAPTLEPRGGHLHSRRIHPS